MLYLDLGALGWGSKAVRANSVPGNPHVAFLPRGQGLQGVDDQAVRDEESDGRLPDKKHNQVSKQDTLTS